MSLRFILGRSGTGKTSTCLEEIRRALQAFPQGSSLIFLVPDHATFQAEYELATSPGLDGMMRAHVLGFRRLAYRVLLEAGGLAKNQIGDLGKRMVLRRLLVRRKGDLQVFHRSAGRPGFVDTLARTISEMKLYRVSPERLDILKEHLKDILLAGKLSDLALLYQDFESYLSGRYIDPDDCLTIAAGRLADSPTLREAEVWVDGFTSFTPQEYEVLRAILRTAARVNVALCLDGRCLGTQTKEHDLFFRAMETMGKLTDLAEESGVGLEPPEILDGGTPYRFRTRPAIAHLERHFFDRPAPRWEADPHGVKLAAAANRRVEVEGVAQEIVRLCREEGYRWQDIMIMTRDLDAYKELFGTVFSDFGIPFFIDSKRTVMHHPLVELIRSALKIVLEDWDYDPVFRYLKTDLVPLSRERVDQLENYVLAHGIKGSRWTDGQPWIYRRQYTLEEEAELSTWEARELEKVNKARAGVVQSLADFHRSMKQAANGREMTAALWQLLASLKVPEKLESWSREAEQQGRLDVAREHNRIWVEVMEVLDQVVEILGTEEMTVEDFAKVIEGGFESLKLSLIPPGLDQVLVGSLDRIHSPNVRAAFLLGVNDGVLPARPGNLGLFTEYERERIEEVGIALAPGGRQRLFDEQFLVYTALTRAKEYLWVSYPMADDEGKAVMPSALVARMKELFPGLHETVLTGQHFGSPEEPDFISLPGQTLSYLAARLPEARKGLSIPRTCWAVYNWALSEPEMRGRLAGIVAGMYHVNQEKPIPAELCCDLYGKKLKISVSRVEKFRACPFAYFLSYGLKLKERAYFKLNPPDLGQFFHTALKMFGERLKQSSLDWADVTTEQGLEIVGEIVEQLAPRLQHEILLSTARHKYLLQKLRRTVERSVLILAEHARRGMFRPVALEIGFGDGEQLPPLVFSLRDECTLELTGRIDRIDRAVDSEGNTYIRIIDYKSGQAGLSLSDIYHGLKLQLLTYLDVALIYAPSLTGGEALPGGMLYFSLGNPVISTTGPLTPEETEQEVMKQLKMQGFVLADPGVVKMMDNQVVQGWSELLPVALTKDGGFYSNASVLDPEQFTILRNYLRQVLLDTGKRILDGEVAIAPYLKKKFSPCRYCSYKPVCQFDLLMNDNNYRIIREEPKEAIWAKLSQVKEGGTK